MATENLDHPESTSAEEHIDLLIKDVENLINFKLDFQAFIVIAIGIEFLGAFTDTDDFNDFGLSKQRFLNSLDHWFKNKYQEKKTWLFENLRGSLVHQYRPGKEIFLTSKCKNGVDLSKHWTIEEGKTIFVLEQLLIDFKMACEKLKREMININSPYNDSKMKEKYLTIYEIDNWNKVKLKLSGHGSSDSFKQAEK